MAVAVASICFIRSNNVAISVASLTFSACLGHGAGQKGRLVNSLPFRLSADSHRFVTRYPSRDIAYGSGRIVH